MVLDEQQSNHLRSEFFISNFYLVSRVHIELDSITVYTITKRQLDVACRGGGKKKKENKEEKREKKRMKQKQRDTRRQKYNF